MVSPVDMDSSGEGSIARVSFRVRCETLGHGEEVFLVRSDDANLSRYRFYWFRRRCYVTGMGKGTLPKDLAVFRSKVVPSGGEQDVEK
eukprot:scaffold421360_cov57-Attheya_sp.AAC.3